jgi:hypothetical protein
MVITAMTPAKYPTLTIGDCLTLMDQLDACLEILNRVEHLHPAETGVKSMLAVLRREIAGRVLEISASTTTHPFRLPKGANAAPSA